MKTLKTLKTLLKFIVFYLRHRSKNLYTIVHDFSEYKEVHLYWSDTIQAAKFVPFQKDSPLKQIDEDMNHVKKLSDGSIVPCKCATCRTSLSAEDVLNPLQELPKPVRWYVYLAYLGAILSVAWAFIYIYGGLQ